MSKPCLCDECGEPYPAKRRELGYKTCLTCGDTSAKAARTSWCIAPAGHKQGDTIHTDPQYLRGLNKVSR
jgi:ribosomal protein L37AE/L43A